MANNSPIFPADSAAAHNLASCQSCHLLSPIEEQSCPRCDSRLSLRKANNIQTTLCLVVTAALFYVPANLLPIMSTKLLGNSSDSTIIGGVVLFLEHGSYFVAFVIFTASVIIPLAKMMAIVWLCWSVHSKREIKHLELTRLYRMTEFIGKWSMIDVFVVAVLVALVQLSGLMSIKPGFAISAFATVVVLTMIAAMQFDVRLIWDRLADEEKTK